MIIRREHNGNFTILPNAIANDERLSIEAIGVLAYLLSRPPNWAIRHAQLQKACRVGRQKLQRIIRELTQAGYLDRDEDQPRDRHNQFTSFNYVARDVPRKDGVSFVSQVDFVQREVRRLKINNGNKKESLRTDINKTPSQSPSPLPRGEFPLARDEDLTVYGRNAQAQGCRFVFENSEPFEAWREFRGEDGLPPIIVEKIDRQLRRGVWLPSLHPPHRSRANAR